MKDRHHYKKPPFPPERPCLKCGRIFRPEHRFNRLCELCHETNEKIEDRYLWFNARRSVRRGPRPTCGTQGTGHIHVILPSEITIDGV